MTDRCLTTPDAVREFITANAEELKDVTANWNLWEQLATNGVSDEFVLNQLKIKRQFYLAFKNRAAAASPYTPYCIATKATLSRIVELSMLNDLESSPVWRVRNFTFKNLVTPPGWSPSSRDYEVLLPNGAVLLYTYFPEAPVIR